MPPGENILFQKLISAAGSAEKRRTAMRLRPYRKSDAKAIRNWIEDERTHALWCGNLLPFPFTEKDFNEYLEETEERWGNSSFTAVGNDGTPAGFLRTGINPALNSGFLGFVVVDAGERGKGCGKEMLRLAVKYAFEIECVQSLALNVFDCNKAAMGLYRNIGFEETALTPECFVFHDEKWGRCRMEIKKE